MGSAEQEGEWRQRPTDEVLAEIDAKGIDTRTFGAMVEAGVNRRVRFRPLIEWWFPEDVARVKAETEFAVLTSLAIRANVDIFVRTGGGESQNG